MRPGTYLGHFSRYLQISLPKKISKSITNCYLNLAYIFNYGKNEGYKSEWIRVHSNKIIPYQDVIKSRIYNDRPILWPILLVIVMIKDRGKKQSELLILINTVY